MLPAYECSVRFRFFPLPNLTLVQKYGELSIYHDSPLNYIKSLTVCKLFKNFVMPELSGPNIVFMILVVVVSLNFPCSLFVILYFGMMYKIICIRKYMSGRKVDNHQSSTSKHYKVIHLVDMETL